MSASLVGSEMCIRDSLKASPDVQPCRAAVEAAGCELQPEWGDGALPVSYTHLTLPTICSV
eukprot:15145780-Alexandrium_andersonii.AAC.1